MDATALTYIISGALGFIGGALGSLIAPWVHWGVEKRRLRQANRRELINSCRMLLDTGIDKKSFRGTEIYSRLRVHLYQSVIDAIERDYDYLSEADKKSEMDTFKKAVLEDVARIETEWVLI